MTKAEIARARQLYRSGRSLVEVAEELGYEPGSARYVARRARLLPRRRGPKGRVDVADETIVALRGQPGQPPGASWPEVAAEVGMSRSGVRARWLRTTGQQRWR